MIHQIIFSGYVANDVPKKVEQESVQRIYNYCEQAGVTGLQLYTDGNFICITEGPMAAIETLQHAYQHDERLSDLVVLLKQNIEKAEFKDFKIGFCKSDSQTDVPGCFILTPENFDAILPEHVSNDTKILTKTFARVNNLLAS